VLDGNEPAVVIELKAPHTGDVRWGRADGSGERAAIARKHGVDNQLEGVIREDAEKGKNAARAGEAYVLVVLTHVADPVPRELDALVKYGYQRRRVADQQEAERTICGYLMRLGETSRLPLGVGTAFGLRCSIDAWLCGPLGTAEA
jgi:hypothetical protein